MLLTLAEGVGHSWGWRGTWIPGRVGPEARDRFLQRGDACTSMSDFVGQRVFLNAPFRALPARSPEFTDQWPEAGAPHTTPILLISKTFQPRERRAQKTLCPRALLAGPMTGGRPWPQRADRAGGRRVAVGRWEQAEALCPATRGMRRGGCPPTVVCRTVARFWAETHLHAPRILHCQLFENFMVLFFEQE